MKEGIVYDFDFVGDVFGDVVVPTCKDVPCSKEPLRNAKVHVSAPLCDEHSEKLTFFIEFDRVVAVHGINYRLLRVRRNFGREVERWFSVVSFAETLSVEMLVVDSKPKSSIFLSTRYEL